MNTQLTLLSGMPNPERDGFGLPGKGF